MNGKHNIILDKSPAEKGSNSNSSGTKEYTEPDVSKQNLSQNLSLQKLPSKHKKSRPSELLNGSVK